MPSVFTPITEGQDVPLQLGGQGLEMFVVNARARGMDLGSGDREGVVRFAAIDHNGQTISLEEICRVRAFMDLGDGSQQLASAYLMPLDPAAMGLDSASITLRVEVRDRLGHRATDTRLIVARLPVVGL